MKVGKIGGTEIGICFVPFYCDGHNFIGVGGDENIVIHFDTIEAINAEYKVIHFATY